MIQLGHPPRDREELWWVVLALFGVAIPRTRVCPDHCSPFDAFADAYFRECTIDDGVPCEPHRVSRVIWHASRGLAGKSKTLSVLGLTLGYLEGADITVLGGSMEQSTNVHNYMVTGMESEQLPPDMAMDVTNTRIKLANKGRVRPIAASQKTARGPHPSALLMDEVDEMELPIYDAALGQPLPQRNYLNRMVETITVLSSTWQNPDGTLTEIFRRNEEAEIRSPIYRWCYKENLDSNNPINPILDHSEGWLTQNTIDDKRNDISAEMFRVEYDLGEPSIGNRAIDTALLDQNFTLGPDDPGGKVIWEKHSKDWDEWRFEQPHPQGVYAAGADWAKEKDKTVVVIVRTDGPKPRIVYCARMNRTAYPKMIGVFNDEVERYRVESSACWHDGTGLGNVIADHVSARARAFTMTGDKRTDLLTKYINSLEKVEWALPKALNKVYTEHKYCQVGDLYASAASTQFHLPDTLCAMALANHGRQWAHGAVAPVGVRSDAPTKHEQEFGNPVDRVRRRTETPDDGFRIDLTV